MERDIDALLGDVRHADGDEQARKRAAEAISTIATRLAAGREADAAGEHNVAQVARQYLSTDYYLQRWAERGLRHRSDRVDDFGFDPTYEARVRPFFELMCSKYFRTEVEGVQNVPSDGRALLVCNHSGSLPWDGVMLRTALQLHHPAQRQLRWLVEDFVFHAPFLGAFINRIGAVRACQENAERLLRDEQLLAVFPEGQKGIEKRYTQRYKLQRFGRGGYIKLALRTGAPVIPVAVVGAEETYPLLYKVKAFSKALGMPYIPVTPTFPWLGPLGAAPLPSRWRIVFGEPITELSQHAPEAAGDDILVGELNERVRTEVQRLVDGARERRGRRAYL
ncbi:MAG TPA: lysophospholipid acyltransferase family protein [Polyangiales bacterium]